MDEPATPLAVVGSPANDADPSDTPYQKFEMEEVPTWSKSQETFQDLERNDSSRSLNTPMTGEYILTPTFATCTTVPAQSTFSYATPLCHVPSSNLFCLTNPHQRTSEECRLKLSTASSLSRGSRLPPFGEFSQEVFCPSCSLTVELLMRYVTRYHPMERLARFVALTILTTSFIPPFICHDSRFRRI